MNSFMPFMANVCDSERSHNNRYHLFYYYLYFLIPLFVIIITNILLYLLTTIPLFYQLLISCYQTTYINLIIPKNHMLTLNLSIKFTEKKKIIILSVTILIFFLQNVPAIL